MRLAAGCRYNLFNFEQELWVGPSRRREHITKEQEQ